VRLRRYILDVSPLRLDRDFRWLYFGSVISGVGNQVTRIVLPYQVYGLTHSTLAIAVLTAVQLVPLLVLSLVAGSVADAVDRRRLLLVTHVLLAITSLALAVLAVQHEPPLVAILIVAAVSASLGAITQPARASATPRLVPPQRLPAAIALNQLALQATSIVGPAIGGLVVATAGPAAAYTLDALTPIGDIVRPGISSIVEGVRFATRRRVILSTFVIDLNAMIFGMPAALFPVLALDVFRTGPAGLGLLAAAPAVGAFVAALLSGWVSAVRRTGRAIIVAVVVWGIAIVGFGLSTFSFGLALAFLAVAGGADVLSAVFRSSLVQLETPDALRGRVTSIHMLAVSSGPQLGDIEAATLASVVGPQISVISGGLLCLVGVVAVVRLFPELLAHRSAVETAPAVPA
jgi:ENTS family enterobactin (siderophore) exporter